MNSQKKQVIMALGRLIPGILIISALLFIPAGSVNYWNASLFMGVLFIPMIFVFSYLVIRDPELLNKRMNTKEKETTQKKVVLLISFLFLSSFIIAALDYRFGWSEVPVFLVVLSALIFLTGYLIFFAVIRQNSYASRVVEIQEKQKVIDPFQMNTRMKNEEEVLERGLDGYIQYKKKVRFKIIPFIW